MTLRFFIFVLFLAAPLSAEAQRTFSEDDTLFFAFDEQVTVTATRVPTRLAEAPAPIAVFVARDIARLPVRNVSELVALSPGAVLRDYGGTGTLQLASLRGMGAEYTLVLLNGLRLNHAQNASVDLGQLSLRQVERVEIARGGFTALYGSSALGGVVNIVTAQRDVRPALQLGFGAFGWKQGQLSLGSSGRQGRLFADFQYEEADNDFSFTPSRGGDAITRQNADMIRRSLTAGGTLLMDEASLTLFADLHSHRAGTPGAVFSQTQGTARQNDDGALLSAQLDWQLSGHQRLRLSSGVQMARQEYLDPGLLFDGQELHSIYDTRRLSLSALLDHAFAGGHRISVGVESAQDVLESDEVRASPHRLQGAAFAAGDIVFSLGSVPLHLYPSLRWDGLRDDIDDRAFSVLTPSVGLQARLLPWLSARARWARSFSAPTFNQLYWREGGNPDLRPEYSTALEGGLTYSGSGLLRAVEVTAFSHDITDKIVWAPGSGIYWAPNNIQQVRSRGLETSVDLRFFRDKLALQLNAQWNSARKLNASFIGDATADKQLIYVPELSGSALLGVSIHPQLSASATLRVLGTRYYTETNDASLPAHAVLDAAVSGRVPLDGLDVEAKLEVRNLLDTAYDVVAFYPMPGRHARFHITTTIP